LLGFLFFPRGSCILAFVVLFSVFLFAEGGEGRSLAEIRRRLPLVGVGAERSIVVVVLSLYAVYTCTGVCATLRWQRVVVRGVLCAAPRLAVRRDRRAKSFASCNWLGIWNTRSKNNKERKGIDAFLHLTFVICFLTSALYVCISSRGPNQASVSFGQINGGGRTRGGCRQGRFRLIREELKLCCRVSVS